MEVSGKEISLGYDSEVKEGEEFEIVLKLIDFPEDVYDLKIDVFSEAGNRISKIYTGNKWQSSFYYVNDFIENDEETEVLLKIQDYSGEGFFEVKVRDSSGNSDFFDGYNIEILESENSGEQEDKEKEKDSDEDVFEDGLGEADNFVENSVSENMHNNIIKLNAKDIKTQENTEKQDNKIPYIGLGIFGFVIVGLLAYKNYRNKRKDGIIWWNKN